MQARAEGIERDLVVERVRVIFIDIQRIRVVYRIEDPLRDRQSSAGPIGTWNQSRMVSAIFGLIGVALGVGLTWVREWWLLTKKTQRDAAYLCALVSCRLDQFSERCAEVVADDGLSEGQPDEQGYHQIQVPEPTLDLDALDVEWKSLPTELMHSVLDHANYAKEVARSASAAFTYATAPDFGEGFEERQFQYARLGLTTSSLAADLRNHAGLSAPMRPERLWDPIEFMTESKEKIERLRRERVESARSIYGE